MKIAVMDFETDPFKYGRVPKPFAWGFYDGEKYVDHFSVEGGESVVDSLVMFLLSIEEPMTIYAHNGGKFDFMFMLKYIRDSILIIGGRITEARIGQHTIRDSYSIIPVALSKFEKGGKLDIDYNKMEVESRGLHREEILTYMKADCMTLYKGVVTFRDEFGDKLTMAGAALHELKKLHDFEVLKGDDAAKKDMIIRQYYYGGRCQCFEVGTIQGQFKVCDVNSMYPAVMRNYRHPVSADFVTGNVITPNTAFVSVRGFSRGAFPMRTKVGIDFPYGDGVYDVTIHEYNTAVELGFFDLEMIVATRDYKDFVSFDTFVDKFYSKRLQAKAEGSELYTLFYKLVLNSSYGKFCQNPDDFKEYFVTLDYMQEPKEGHCKCGEDPCTCGGWLRVFASPLYCLWQRPAVDRQYYYNVATGASITGAARAELMRGLSKATRPIYCDTDSIICEALDADHDPKKLGAWKEEATGDTLHIAGKKMYVVTEGGNKIKQASKGALMAAHDIIRVSQGENICVTSDAPTFSIKAEPHFQVRNIKRTGTPGKFGVK